MITNARESHETDCSCGGCKTSFTIDSVHGFDELREAKKELCLCNKWPLKWRKLSNPSQEHFAVWNRKITEKTFFLVFKWEKNIKFQNDDDTHLVCVFSLLSIIACYVFGYMLLLPHLIWCLKWMKGPIKENKEFFLFVCLFTMLNFDSKQLRKKNLMGSHSRNPQKFDPRLWTLLLREFLFQGVVLINCCWTFARIFDVSFPHFFPRLKMESVSWRRDGVDHVLRLIASIWR